jgi:energy-coupling factor transporter ATP-binding protein EcfA2
MTAYNPFGDAVTAYSTTTPDPWNGLYQSEKDALIRLEKTGTTGERRDQAAAKWRAMSKIARDEYLKVIADGKRRPGKAAKKADAIEADDRRLGVEWANTITPLPVKWRWEGRIAVGELTLLAGREGVGKSTIAYDLAGAITTGRLPGDLYGKPANVLVAAAEDSWEHTIVPRLMAAGAELARVARIKVFDLDVLSSDQVDLPRDLERLRDLIVAEGVALVLLDPLVSRLGANLDTHKDAEVRRALEPLKAIADTTNTAILGLIHLNKSGGQDPLNQVMGSRAFGAVARSTLFAMRSGDDEDAYLLGNPKNNLGKQASTMTYKIAGHHVTDTAEGEEIWTAKIQWTGESDQSIHDALSEANAGEPAGSTQDAIVWLRDYLIDSGGGAESAQAKKHAKDCGHNERTLTRARQKLGVTVETQKGVFPRQTYWILPAGMAS